MHFTISVIGAVAGAGVLACVTASGRAGVPGQITAIEHVTAITMDGDRVIDEATILVEGERITEVGPAAGVRVPAGARRIEGRGLYAVPGFADMHVHPYDTEGFASYLAYGITTIGVMHGSPTVLEWRERVRRGALDGPTIYTAGPTVNGYPPGNPLFVAVQTPEAARTVAREQHAAGYDFIKAYSFLNPDVYAALLDEAHRQRIAVVGHIPFQLGYAPVLTAGQANVAHIEEFFQNGDVPDDSMPVIARRVKASGATVTANLFAYADYLRTIPDLPGVLADPEMRFASPAQYSEKIPTSNRATNRPDQAGFAKFLRERLVRFQMLLRAFEDAGVPVLVGTDTETFGFPGQSAYLEMLQMRVAGATPRQVLEAASSNAGDFVSRNVPGAERFGRIAPGMRADIVLLRANPLADVRNASNVAGTMARGRWYPAEKLSHMRDSVGARNTPLRAFVTRFDSVMVKAKDAAAGAAMLREYRAQHPSSVPLAELVWIGYGRMNYAQDKVNSTAIRQMMVEAYPRSSSAYNQVGRAFLFRFDTAEALRWFHRAADLAPNDLAIHDMIAKVETARRGEDRSAIGRYELDPVTVKVHGDPRLIHPTVVIGHAESGPSARVFVDSDTGVVASEIVAGAREVWVVAPYAGQDLELRWQLMGDDVRGTWTYGWANNGELVGRRRANGGR